MSDDIVGQDAVLRSLEGLLDMTESDEEQDELERQNADRIEKITGLKGTQLRARFADRRRARQQERNR